MDIRHWLSIALALFLTVLPRASGQPDTDHGPLPEDEEILAAADHVRRLRPRPPGPETLGTGRADALFHRLDGNGDGLLNADEMSAELRAASREWDANGDGFIELPEYRVYFQARVRRALLDEAAAPAARNDRPAPNAPAANAEGGRPAPDWAGPTPPELPAWFGRLDADGDGQVGLYEWKRGGEALAEFARLDRNDDGFLTAAEVLFARARAGDVRTPSPAPLVIRGLPPEYDRAVAAPPPAARRAAAVRPTGRLQPRPKKTS